MKIPLLLALRELRHEWIAATCFVAALVGVLGPMLILLALKNGIIDNMVTRLVENPANREIIAVGAGHHDAAFFTWLRGRPDVAFVSPATRTINASADALSTLDRHRAVRDVPLIVSATGDPLVPAPAVSPGHIWISARTAKELGAKPGDRLRIYIGRDIDGRKETATAQMDVIGIVPRENYGRPAIFLSLHDMLAVERFRDRVAVTTQDWMAKVPPPPSYESFRLYVRDLSDLDRVTAALAARGVPARPRAENAVLLLNFRDNLNRLYSGIAVLALAGFWAAMAANLRGMVERQRTALSLLRLLGLRSSRRMLMPLFESGLLIGAGLLVTLAVVFPVLLLINARFPEDVGQIAYLGAGDLAATVGLCIATSVTAALWAMAAVRRISSEEVLRHG